MLYGSMGPSFQEASLACDVICEKTGSPAHGTKSDLSPEGFRGEGSGLVRLSWLLHDLGKAEGIKI